MNSIRISISVLSLSGLLAHLIWPDLNIDAIAFGFILLALLPWLAPVIKSIEIPGVGKVELQQQPDPESSNLPEQNVTQDSMGFYTRDGLDKLIKDSGLVEDGEKVRGKLQIFRTEKQRTWLVCTSRQIFCVLDDSSTRSSGRLIQWRLTLDQATPVRVHTSGRDNPVIDIGPRKNWLYSTSIHPDRSALEADVANMVEQARLGVS